MTLNAVPEYPAHRCYLVKLHRSAHPQGGRLIGRLEHIASGDHVEFDSAQALVDWLVSHATSFDVADARFTPGSEPDIE